MRAENIIQSIFIALLILILIFSYTHGFIPHDEGWIINPADRISQGQLPYRDFHYIYTPGVAYTIGLVFKIFGPSIVLSRIITLIFSLLTIFSIIKLSKYITKKYYHYFLPVLIYVTWGPMHINFAWPVIYAIWSGILTCLLLLVSIKKKSYLYFFLSGITTGLTILFKQNFGFALLINNLIFYIILRKSINKNHIFSHIFGVFLIPSAMLIYFLQNNALVPLINDLYFFMIEKYLLEGMQSTPFIYPDIWFKQIIKTILYLSPLIISTIAAILSFKKNKNITFIATFTFTFYLLGIRPTTDQVHLVPLLSITGIPLLIIYTLIKNDLLKKAIILFQILFILLGFYSALYRNYYRWNTPLIYQNKSIDHPRLGVFSDDINQRLIVEIQQFVDKHTKPKSYIFIYNYSPSFYLLTDRKNPTKFIFMPHNLLTKNDMKEIIQNLKNKKVKVIITDIDIMIDKSILSDYIQENYKPMKELYNYKLWLIK